MSGLLNHYASKELDVIKSAFGRYAQEDTQQAPLATRSASPPHDLL